MSDFAGIWRLDGRPIGDADVSRLSSGLEARGIGAARIWREGPLAIVHRQHFFTPEDRFERQPLIGPSGGVLAGGVLACDVRLDNRRELAPLLGLDGPTVPDSAFVLRALECWGPGAMAHLYGDISLAYWQPQRQTLWLARTHLRQRAVFVHRGAEMIAFASRLRPLLALPEIPLDMDEAAIADTLVLNQGPHDRTHYKAIRRVPLAHLVEVTRDTIRTQRFWSMPQPGSLRFKRAEDVVEAASETVDRAVAACLRSEGPVGIGLTGGLDSTAIALSAHRQAPPGRFFALTLVPNGATAPPDPRFCRDESADAQALAALHPGLEWHRVAADGEDWGEWDRRRWFLEAGIASDNRANAAWFFPAYRFIAKRGGNVFVGGGMGNFFFSSDGGAVGAALLRQGRWRDLWRLLRDYSRSEKTGILRALSQQVLRPYRPLSTLYRRDRRWTAPWFRVAAIQPEFAAQTGLAQHIDLGRYRLRFGGKHRDIATTREYILMNDTASDWAGPHRALSGIEIRNPLADRRLIEFFAALPQEEFIRDGIPRSLARAVIARGAPPKTVNNRRIGEQLSDWHAILTARRAAMREALPRLRNSPSARRMIDLDRLERQLDDWPADAAEAEGKFMEAYWVLSRGIEYAEFLAWREQSNA